MGTTLRLGLAMGGGNSLGTFSGAALSQALKLLLLRGIDRNGEPYRRVEVDVFSGASAGSLSLSLMLKGLVHPDPGRMKAAKARLTAEFEAEFTEASRNVKKALIAAQILQDVQEEVWVREVNLDKLLGLSSREGSRRIRCTAGFLDRGAVEELARRYLAFPTPPEKGPNSPVDLSKRRILADRVLFASSIANLTPILADARREYPSLELALTGLLDGLTSSVHRELRLFDLHFSPVDADILTDSEAFPRRWCRYHAGPTVRDLDGSGRGIGSLFEPRAWSKIAATSIASAAIPLAFEPVPLERRAYEFGETQGGDGSRWPEALSGKDRHVFTYVDGGTFNNEPVREAFRMASFIDAQSPEADFERLVLFVDPHVTVQSSRMALDHHGAWLLEPPKGVLATLQGGEVRKRSSLDRLIPLSGSLLAAVTNESRVMEADKIFQTRKRFGIRNLIREEMAGTLSRNPEASSLETLAARLRELLDVDRVGAMIPAGALTLEGELRRVIVEEGGMGHPLSILRGKAPEEVRTFANDPGSAEGGERGVWLRALTFVAVDRVMDLEGKMEGSQLLAISPATDPSDPSQLEELPGGLVHGFGGFMSELAGEYEVELGRYCTQLFLQAAGRIEKRRLPKKPDFSSQRTLYLKEIRSSLEKAEDRLVQLVADSHVGLLGALPAGVLRYLIRGRLAGLAKERPKPPLYELRLQVPNMSYEFDGRGLVDVDLTPRKIDGKFYLITFATHDEGDPKPWRGPNVSGKKQALRVDRDRKGVSTDREFCRVTLPTKAILKGGQHLPYPIWVARISKADKGKRIGSDRWRLLDEVVGLDRKLLA